MAEFDTIIRNGSIATASDVFDSDIGIKDGIITALSNNLSDADEIIDAKGMYVLPGGVDAHVHLMSHPFMTCYSMIVTSQAPSPPLTVAPQLSLPLPYRKKAVSCATVLTIIIKKPMTMPSSIMAFT